MLEGLFYRPAFLGVDQEEALVAWIDSQPWETELSRRRQFYGGQYDTGGDIEPLPAVLQEMAVRLKREGLVREVPDQALINEYLPGQGIAAHVDHHPRFGDQVVMVSLLDSYPMRFAKVGSDQVVDHWLERRSVCVISGPSRYEWTHEIAKRKADFVDGGDRRLRGRRLSVTFRKWTSIDACIA